MSGAHFGGWGGEVGVRRSVTSNTGGGSNRTTEDIVLRFFPDHVWSHAFPKPLGLVLALAVALALIPALVLILAPALTRGHSCLYLCPTPPAAYALPAVAVFACARGRVSREGGPANHIGENLWPKLS